MGNRNRQEDSIDDLLERLNQMYGSDQKSGGSSEPAEESTGSCDLDPELRRLLEQAIAEGEGDPKQPSAVLSAEDLPERPAGEDRDEITARAAELFSRPTEQDEAEEEYPSETPAPDDLASPAPAEEDPLPAEDEEAGSADPSDDGNITLDCREAADAAIREEILRALGETSVFPDPGVTESAEETEPVEDTEPAIDIESAEDTASAIDFESSEDTESAIDFESAEDTESAIDFESAEDAESAMDFESSEDFSATERSPELAPWEDTPTGDENAQMLADVEPVSTEDKPFSAEELVPAEEPVSTEEEPVSVEEELFLAEEEPLPAEESISAEEDTVSEEEPLPAEEPAPVEEPLPAEEPASAEKPVSTEEELFLAEEEPLPAEEPISAEEDTVSEEEPLPAEEPTSVEEPVSPAASVTDEKQQPPPVTEKSPVKNGASALPPEFRDGRILTDSDIRMLLDLGYERELADFIGYDRIDLVRREGTGVSTPDGARRRKKKKNKAPRRNGNLAEYTDRDQNYEMRARFRERRRHLYIRFAGTLLFAVLLLIYDMPRLFGISGFGALNPEKLPGLYAFFGLQLLLLSAVLSFRQILRGARRASAFEADLYFMPILLILFNAIYDVLLLIFAKSGVPNLFHFVTVLYLLFAIGGELLLLCREEMTFDTVSAEGNRYTLEHVGYNEADGAVYQVRKTGFLSGTLARMRTEEPLRILNILSYAAVLFSLLMSAGGFILSGDLTEAISVFMKSLTLTTPLCSCLAFTLPQFFATRELHKRGCCVIGDVSVQEYSAEKTVMFREEDIFKAGSRIGFSSAGRRKLAEQFHLAGALFRKLGGTLGSVLDLSIKNAETHERVEVGEIGEDGLTATVGTTNAVLGSASYLRAHGITLPPESAERAYLRRSDCVPLYVAFDGEVSLIFEMTYRIGEETEQMIHDLAENGTHVGVNVTDPCLTTPFVWRLRRLEPEHIKLCRVSHVLGDESFRSIDGGISAGRAKDLVFPLIACRRLGQTRRTVTGILGLSAGISATFVAVLLFTGIMPYLTPLMIALYQLIWLAPVAIASGSRLNREGK